MTTKKPKPGGSALPSEAIALLTRLGFEGDALRERLSEEFDTYRSRARLAAEIPPRSVHLAQLDRLRASLTSTHDLLLATWRPSHVTRQLNAASQQLYGHHWEQLIEAVQSDIWTMEEVAALAAKNFRETSAKPGTRPATERDAFLANTVDALRAHAPKMQVLAVYRLAGEILQACGVSMPAIDEREIGKRVRAHRKRENSAE
ncbi:hypothetical protein [Piscinibacter sp.]|uniref:hypothetical protein n=1 Tax=Piscinibacter sp. TaxID=1903157 RepID=UPI002C28A45B|nr:hypothetical protein [Albitalea sp.]HUG26223.1 hypothetical protein [Albitalea sp.]